MSRPHAIGEREFSLSCVRDQTIFQVHSSCSCAVVHVFSCEGALALPDSGFGLLVWLQEELSGNGWAEESPVKDNNEEKYPKKNSLRR